MVRNWDDLGIEWTSDDVSKVFGENNQSDRRVVGTAQLPVVKDIDKLAAAGVDVLAWLNASNSMRVRSQAIARAHKGDVESLREKVWAALRGQRNVGTRTTTIVRHPIPGGEMYEGTDENEYRSLYAAALVDLGVDAERAIEAATKAGW